VVWQQREKRRLCAIVRCGETSAARHTAIVKSQGPEQVLKAQLARELIAILDGYQRDAGAAHIDAHVTELSRLRRGDLRRFSLARIVRYLARAGYDIEVQLKKTPHREHRPQPRRLCSTVVRFDYYGRVTSSSN
jgi:predicted XRE-type DNA-binding protein